MKSSVSRPVQFVGAGEFHRGHDIIVIADLQNDLGVSCRLQLVP